MSDEQGQETTGVAAGAVGLSPRVFHGRGVILCSEQKVDESNVVLMYNRARLVQATNSCECDYLHRYFLGSQPVLQREKDVRPEINNKVVENRAYQMAKDRADALVGEPITYSVRGTGEDHKAAQSSSSATDEVSHKVQRLNECCEAADKHAGDLELAQWLCECGIGFRIVLPNGDEADREERPFLTATLDPRSTFVVRSNDVFKRPVFAGTTVRDEVTGEELTTIYTQSQCFLLKSGEVAEVSENVLGMIPIVEYQLNPERMGVFEAVLALFDAINEIESNRVDGVAQFIQSLMVFENVDFENKDDWDEMRRKGAVLINSTNDVAAKVYLLSAELNQQQTQTLVDNLYKTALSICGMPFNVGGSASTSDTGAAVTMRDGWSNSENRCKETEAMWKRSERLFLGAALKIMDTFEHTGLRQSQVEVKFTRRNYEANQSKAQVLSTLFQTGIVHPRDALAQCGMFTDPEAVYDAGMAWRSEEQERVQRQFESQQLLEQAKQDGADKQANPGGDAGGDSKDGKGDVTPEGKGKRPPSSKRSQKEGSE